MIGVGRQFKDNFLPHGRGSGLITALRQPRHVVCLRLGNIGNQFSNDRDLRHELPRACSPNGGTEETSILQSHSHESDVNQINQMSQICLTRRHENQWQLIVNYCIRIIHV